ncbi:MAG: transposase [Bryobacterales bacterium]|nr:transposase [Bryobacterales bacterium]
MLRRLDAVLSFDRVTSVLANRYSTTGRPSLDPKLMLPMLLIGYAYGIRSERLLYREVHVNLAYRWFCRLGLEGSVPDHSAEDENRRSACPPRERNRSLSFRLHASSAPDVTQPFFGSSRSCTAGAGPAAEYNLLTEKGGHQRKRKYPDDKLRSHWYSSLSLPQDLVRL